MYGTGNYGTNSKESANSMEQTNKGKTYILVRPYFMADHILQALEDNPDYVIFNHQRKRSFLAKILRQLGSVFPSLLKCNFIKSQIFTGEYLTIIENISADDKVILWAIENEKDIKILSHLLPTRNIISFLWDPMRQVIHDSHAEAKRYPIEMKKAGINVCTFDRNDAEKYGFEYVGQVYRAPKRRIQSENKENDVFFVGADKGRAKILADLAAYFQSNGIDYNFKLLDDKHSRLKDYPILMDSLISNPLSYDEALRNIEDAGSLLDILQPGQSGVTIRSMEALFYGKKLITNNPEIIEEDFYDYDRIFILGRDEKNGRDLKQFILTPLKSLPTPDILSSHEIKTWIRRLGNVEKIL